MPIRGPVGMVSDREGVKVEPNQKDDRSRQIRGRERARRRGRKPCLTIGDGDIVVKTLFGRLVAALLGLIGVIFTRLVDTPALGAVGESMKGIKKSKN